MSSASTPSLVVQTSFLGDMVLTTPLFAALHARGETVDVLATPAASSLIANDPAIRDVLVFDKRGADAGARGFLALSRRLRARRYGSAYLAQGSMRSGLLTLAAGIPKRVGFERSAGRHFYSRRITYDDSAHHSRRLLALGGITDAVAPRLYPSTADVQAADGVLGDAGAFVALAPGSVWETKRWPYFAELAATLSPDATVVIVGGRDDSDGAARIVGARNGARTIDATGRLSLLASAEVIRRARVLVTNDSLPTHLASAMGTPTITLFGPTVPDFGFGPLAPSSRVLGLDGLACRPCDRHGPRRCPLGHWRCMRELTPAVVAAVATEMLA